MIVGGLLGFALSVCVNAFLIWLVAKRVARDPRSITFWLAVYCVALLTVVGLLAGIAGGFAGAVIGFVSPVVGGIVGVAVFLFLYLKWGAKVVDSAFDMQGGGSTILVVYLVVCLGISLGVNWLKYQVPASTYPARPSSVRVMSLNSPAGAPSGDGTEAAFGGESDSEAGAMAEETSVEDQAAGAREAEESTGPGGLPKAIPRSSTASGPLADQLLGNAQELMRKAGERWNAQDYKGAIASAEEALKFYRGVYPEDHAQIVQVKQMIEGARRQLAPAATP